MSAVGLRKVALYLATLDERERKALTAGLPAASMQALQALISEVIQRGWRDPELVGRALAGDMQGLTAQSTLPVETLAKLAQRLPADWIARIFAANPAIDTHFLVAMLDAPVSLQVRDELKRIPKLPEKLREAILAEAGRLQEDECAV